MNKVSIKKIGVIGASAIVAGNMMGSGISLLPASFAAIGSITIISWFITLIGALSLAYVFSRLGLIDPQEGGPVAYARKLSPVLGFQAGLLYWIANWIGNLAIAITGVEYLSVFYQPLADPLIEGIAVISIIWIFTVINFFGADKVVKIVSVTIILLLIPVIGTAIFGWGSFSAQQFKNNWNVSNTSDMHAIFAGILLAIWSFIGVESASVSAGVVKKPNFTIPFATLIGTLLAAVSYIASTTVISGMFPAKEIAASEAPFAVSFGAIVGNWVQPYVSIFTAAACLASLGSWMMIVSQAGKAAAQYNILPAIFAKTSQKKGLPVAGLIINSLLMTALMIVIMIIGYKTGQTAIETFSYIISIAVLLTILPYFYSALQLIKFEKISQKKAIHFVIAIFACIFCFVALTGAESIELVITLIASLICFVIYASKKNVKKGV